MKSPPEVHPNRDCQRDFRHAGESRSPADAPSTALALQPPAATAPPASGSDRLGAYLWFRDAAIAAVLASLFVLFLYQPVRVEGFSMMPRLHNNERIFINKFVYHFENIQRGDVVVFWYPLDTSKSFIKRVIGLPGDRVEIVDGQIYINGRRLIEPYVLPRYRDHWSYPPVVVPPDHYFVLGDHRNSSNDSRSWGFLDRDYIYGKASFAYWPMDCFGLVH